MAEQYENELALIRYHAWWPGISDPFYQFNMEDNRTRIFYYGADYVTHVYVDGILDGDCNREIWEDLCWERIPIESPFEITITGHYDYNTRDGNLEVRVLATDQIYWNDLRLQCAMVENGIYWEAPNGLIIHNQTMRDMVPDGIGESFDIQEGESIEFQRLFHLDQILTEDSCQVVVFVQSHDSKEILQSAKMTIPELNQTVVRGDPIVTPARTGLSAAYPNPFNGSTNIVFNLPAGQSVRLEVFDLLGRRVAAISEGNFPAGEHRVTWDGADHSSGVYFARLSTGERTDVIRMALLK